jgi:hypothetical protein
MVLGLYRCRNFRLEGNQLVFKEMFQEETFTPANITHIEKNSEEIINFSTTSEAALSYLKLSITTIE